MKLHFALALLVATSLPYSSAYAQNSGWAVVAKAGTQGFGADIHRELIPKTLNLRTGASFFQYSMDFDDHGIKYGGQLRLAAVPVMLDIYPFKNWFRISAGFEVNLNRAVGTAMPYQGTITINHRTYPVDQIGQLKGTFEFNRFAPLLGLGFSNPIKQGRHWGVTFDIGGIYHGKPRFPITVSGPLFSQLSSDLKNQQIDVEKDVEKYPFYPIVQLGISYHFGKQ
jgi:hypothetical protein